MSNPTFLAPFKPLTWTSPDGRFTVTVDRITTGGYRLETSHTGGAIIDPLTIGHPDEDVTRDVARVICLAFRAAAQHPGNAEADIEDARQRVVAHLNATLGTIVASDTIDACALGETIQDVKALFETADDQAWADKLIAEINALHGREVVADEPAVDAPDLPARPATLAEMARITRATHPQVGPVRRNRRRTVNGVAR